MSNKPVFIQTTSGGVHQGSPRDTIEPLINQLFAFIGISDLRFTFAEGLNQPQLKDAGWQRAVEQVQQNLAPINKPFPTIRDRHERAHSSRNTGSPGCIRR